jgi:serine/threonine protein phosphatase PrpC
MLNFIKDQMDVQECADGLGALALDTEHNSRDNVSCIVIEVVENT